MDAPRSGFIFIRSSVATHVIDYYHHTIVCCVLWEQRDWMAGDVLSLISVIVTNWMQCTVHGVDWALVYLCYARRDGGDDDGVCICDSHLFDVVPWIYWNFAWSWNGIQTNVFVYLYFCFVFTLVFLLVCIRNQNIKHEHDETVRLPSITISCSHSEL